MHHLTSNVDIKYPLFDPRFIELCDSNDLDTHSEYVNTAEGDVCGFPKRF